MKSIKQKNNENGLTRLIITILLISLMTVSACGSAAGAFFPDNDRDGVSEIRTADGKNTDNCPNTWNPGQEDSDNDRIGDACDAHPFGPDGDLDGDKIPDNQDNCPNTPNQDQKDTDHDGIGDACDNDIDGDGIDNPDDICPISETCLQDIDGDNISNEQDNCPNTANPAQEDRDHDGIGDACDSTNGIIENIDTDMDGIPDVKDNCPDAYNPEQLDLDHDGIGSTCESFDKPMLNFEYENPSVNYEIQKEEDISNIISLTDLDGDGMPNSQDNCPGKWNPGQEDSDNDGIGDACDNDIVDTDKDRIPNATDNCPNTWNPGQEDMDNDEIGDACDNDIDGDGIINNKDPCPNGEEDASPECISTQSPKIRLIAPAQGEIINHNNFEFNFAVADDKSWMLDCRIQSDIYGSMKTIHQMRAFNSNIPFIGLIKNSYNVEKIADGNYKWNVECRDSQLNVGRSSENKFSINTQLQNTCHNGIMDGSEEGIDCGGICQNACILPVDDTNPLVSLSYEKEDDTAPSNVRFTATVMHGESPFAYTIEFGDGQTEQLNSNSRKVTFNHIYREEGKYRVTLSVSDRDNDSAGDEAELIMGPAVRDSSRDIEVRSLFIGTGYNEGMAGDFMLGDISVINTSKGIDMKELSVEVFSYDLDIAYKSRIQNLDAGKSADKKITIEIPAWAEQGEHLIGIAVLDGNEIRKVVYTPVYIV